MGKIGWAVFIAGFIVSVVGSIPGPKEKVVIREDLSFQKSDFQNVDALLQELKSENSQHVAGHLSKDVSKDTLASELNEILANENFYSKEAFAKKSLSPNAQRLAKRLTALRGSAHTIVAAREKLSALVGEVGQHEQFDDAKKPLESALDILGEGEPNAHEQQQQLSSSLPEAKKAGQMLLAKMSGELKDVAINLQIKLDKVVMEIEMAEERARLLVSVSKQLNRFLLEEMYPTHIHSAASLPSWYVVLMGSIVAIAGLSLIYRARHQLIVASSNDETGVSGGKISPRECLDAIISSLEKIDFSDKELSREDVISKIEKVQMELILPFVEGRESLSHRMGLGKFTLMYADFATADRYLNRSWSAMVDHHNKESQSAMEVSIEHFKEALNNLG